MTIARRAVTGLVAIIAVGALGAAAASADTLYIGEGTDSTVQSFNAMGDPFGTFISAPPEPPAALAACAAVNTTCPTATGPMGILHLSNADFLVAYQNPGLPINGEIDRFSSTGQFLGPLVPSTDPNAPFAPTGIILGPDKKTLYVADFGESASGPLSGMTCKTASSSAI